MRVPRTPSRASGAALLALALAFAGCRTISTREVSSTPTPSVRVGKRARTWEVRCADAVLGRVVLFEDRVRELDSVYIVRNPWDQDLGLIDALGRAFRYVPHREEPVWVGSGTISVGAQHILGASAACELIEEVEPGETAGPLPGTLPATAAEPLAQPSAGPSDDPPSDGGLPQSR